MSSTNIVKIKITMSQNFFHLLNHAFKLMSENRLRKDIDDTLLEKLLTLIKKIKVKESNRCAEINARTPENHSSTPVDFIEELLNRTDVLHVVEKVLSSTADRNENHPTLIKSFVIRLLGLIFSSPKKFYSYGNLLPLLKSTDENMIMDHHPSIQDALLDCLSCITKEYEGAIWFIDQNLIDFVFSSFYSTSYYVRKSAMNFIIAFVSQWMNFKLSDINIRKLGENYLENILKNFISDVVYRIHFYKNSKEIVFAQCCISVMKQLLVLQNIESLIGDHLEFVKNISECFMDLTEDVEFNKKLADLLLAIHFKFALPIESINDVVKCLIIKNDIKLAFDLTSSFISMSRSKNCCPDELMFFLLPLHILMNKPLTNSNDFFTLKADLVYNIMLKKLEDKSECKTLVSSSLSALQKVTPQMKQDNQKIVGREVLSFVTTNSNQERHKWFYLVLEDRAIHHAFIELYSSFLSEEVYISLRSDGSDLVFKNIMEFLKKPTSDCNKISQWLQSFHNCSAFITSIKSTSRITVEILQKLFATTEYFSKLFMHGSPSQSHLEKFLSQLLLLMKDVLVLHEKFQFSFEESERSSLIQVLCRGLHDNRESIIDSALQLAGQMINSGAWQNNISEQGIYSIIWDIAIQGNHDGTIRSTALKVIIEGCLKDWCLNEMKSLKGISETDIVKILFDLTFNRDFFLQREALSCLFQWMKSKWNELELSSKDYLFSALVTAIKSLDLEQKLLSLDVWLWLLENKFTFSDISPSLEVKKFIEYLASSGFGLSMILALEDYDLAIQFKAADILGKLQKTLTSRGISFDSLTITSSNVDGAPKCNIFEELAEPVTKEEKDKGIDIVMEISTTDQITNICRPSMPEPYNFKQEYFPSDSEERKCPVSSFWVCLWSENVSSILQPSKLTEDIYTDGESLLNDIISAGILEYDSVEDTPDCY